MKKPLFEIKKNVSLFLAAVTMFAFCACTRDKGESSATAEKESAFSSEITVSETASNDTSSKVSSSKKESSENTGSEKSPTSAASSSNDTSSKVPSKNASWNYTSFSQSDSVTKNINPANAAGVGVYHFQPGWTTNYGKEEKKRLEEFRDVIEAGYFNSVMVSGGSWVLNDEFWDICLKNDVQVWICFWDIFSSAKKSFNEHYASLFDTLEKLKKHPDRWKQFVGFHWEEPMWRSETNADFLLETGNLYRKYGKRIFPVFATGEFSEVEGNENSIQMTAADMRKVRPEALKYVTDIAYDSYSVDVRDGASNGSYISRVAQTMPKVHDGKSYYEEYTNLLVRLTGHEVNVWFFPCAYRNYLWSGGWADESYCLAHLNFFRELLLKQMYKGGMFLYTYKTFRESEPGLEYRLVVNADLSSSETYKLCPDKEKWKYYSKRLREITAEFKTMSVQQIYGL